jgi:hypothetical protein
MLLSLARELTAGLERPTDVGAVVLTLSNAYAPGAPLATALREDWLRGANDKTARLALAWAREQVRLALAEVLQRASGGSRPRGDVDTLAWLLLAACEALAHDPPSAVTDRAQALAAFLAVT